MKRGHIVGFCFLLVIIVLASCMVSADYPNHGKISSTEKSTLSKYGLVIHEKHPPKARSAVEILWPEAGYYYVADYMLLWIKTQSASECSYSFGGSAYEPMEIVESGGTDHSHFLENLADNMASEDPYVVDFKCTDQDGESTAETWFWISTTDLDKYFLRNNIEDWTYLDSGLDWSGNENGLLETYRGFYEKGNEDVYTRVEIDVFDSEDSARNAIEHAFQNKIPEVINGQDVYRFSGENSSNFAVWSSGNKLLFLKTYSFENTTAVDTSVPLSVLGAYLGKYPSDSRSGVCGDGKVDILNSAGVHEECDENTENNSCGTGIGVCTGQSVKTCNNDCTWGQWSECNAPQPTSEICDSLDNNCNGAVDEGGVCIVPNKMSVNSPSNSVFNEGKVQFNITMRQIVDRIVFIDGSDNRPREKILCSKSCMGYGNDKIKFQTFNDGLHNITFKAIKNNSVIDEKTIGLWIDSKDPQISKTEPKSRSFTNGSDFYVRYTEDNCQSLGLNIFSSQTSVSSGGDSCQSGTNIEKNMPVALSSYNGQEIEYQFVIKDIANNTAESKRTKVNVDTTSPVINSFNYSINKKSVNFVLNVTENNLDGISYIDSNDARPREATLCSKLKNGICSVKKTFKAGEHNLVITALDKAGNSATKNLQFTIN